MTVIINFTNTIQVNFSGDLDKFSKLKTQKEKTEKKKQMCLIKLQNYTMIC